MDLVIPMAATVAAIVGGIVFRAHVERPRPYDYMRDGWR